MYHIQIGDLGKEHCFSNDWTAIAYKRKHDGYDLPQLKPTDCQFFAPQVVAEAFREELNLILTSCFAREPKEGQLLRSY
jgi:hypothetical protein